MKNSINSASNVPLALLLLLEVVTVLVPVILLGKAFHFPAVLRQPAANAFALFIQNRKIIIPAYYTFLVSSLTYLPLAALLKNRFKNHNRSNVWLELMYVATIAAGIFQAIGFSRWVFVMPYLSEQYSLPGHRANAILFYEWMNRFLGMGIGEHLGFLTMGFGMIALNFTMEGNKWFRRAGRAIGLMLMISVLEHFSGPYAAFWGKLNIAANTLWTLWMAWFAVMLLPFYPAKKMQPL